MVTFLRGLIYPEGPRWHEGALWFSDLCFRTITRVDEGGRAEAVARIDDAPSGIGFLPDGTPLVVSMNRKQILRVADGSSTLHADLSAFPGDALNDMLVDDHGRAYVGMRVRRPVTTRHDALRGEAILVVQPDGRTDTAADAIVSPNGCVITPDGTTFIAAETYAHRLSAFDRDSDGRLSNRRTLWQLDGVWPDGICLDAAGAVWIASIYSNEVLRVLDGEVTDRISAGDARPVACMLGGKDRRSLFVLLSSITHQQLSEIVGSGVPATLAQFDDAPGWIEVRDVDVPAAGWP